MNLFLIINDSATNESPKTVEFEFTVLHDESRLMEGNKMHAVHSFVVSGKENPILEINKGDLVMISFVNTDKMVKHDLVIPELNLQTKILDYEESAELQFRPSAMGNFVYLCSLHPDQMKGSFVIIWEKMDYDGFNLDGN